MCFSHILISCFIVFRTKKKKTTQYKVKCRPLWGVCWITCSFHFICVRSPLLRLDYEMGAPAVPPPRPEQIQGRQEPTPGITNRNTSAHCYFITCALQNTGKHKVFWLNNIFGRTWNFLSAERKSVEGRKLLLSINTVRPFSLAAGLMRNDWERWKEG